IGIFLTFIGLKNAGLIASDPITFVKLGTLGIPALLTILAIGLSVWLLTRQSAFAFLAGIFFATVIGWALGLVIAPESFFSAPDFHTVFFNLKLTQLG
ncbi:MAG: NCS2 family permease, partial [Pyrinomonadaceae bacterium]